MSISLWGAVVQPLRQHHLNWSGLSPDQLSKMAGWLRDSDVLGHLADLAAEGQDDGAEDDTVLCHVVEARMLLEEAASEHLDPRLLAELGEIDAALGPLGAGVAHLLSTEAWGEITGDKLPLPGFLAGWRLAREERSRQNAEAHRRLTQAGAGVFPPGFTLGDDVPPTERGE